MKKFILGILTFLSLGFGTLFAQNILPDEAKIEVKSPVIQGEATNLTITMMKNGSKMTSYRGRIYITVTNEDGSPLKANDYVVPYHGVYTFSDTDLGSTTFEKGLEIKKEGTFYIEVEDSEDPERKAIGREPITVIKNTIDPGNAYIDILSPIPDTSLSNEKVEIIAKVPELKNSNAVIYIDDNVIGTTLTSSEGMIDYVIKEMRQGKHSLRIEVLDMDGTTPLGSSDIINFTTEPTTIEGARVTVEPEEGVRVGEMVKITAHTNEMIETVKITLSDREANEAVVLPKVGNGEFSSSVLLVKPGIVSISLETSASKGSTIETIDNIKQFTVLGAPAISNIITGADAEEQTATLSWDVLNGDASYYFITYRTGEEQNNILKEKTETKSFEFLDVPYDTPLYVTITPYRNNGANHGAASETIRFLITKPQQEPTTQDPGGETVTPHSGTVKPRCIVENISTRTTKIGENYYLIWDKVENVSKYIVYSSTMPDGSDKMKVYETSDTSYQYPFDKTSEEDKFAYFWIVGICDDGEELELTGATKVQVGPAENFFLLICMTFLIYFGIKLFRQTEE